MKGYVVYMMRKNYDVNILTGEKTDDEAKEATSLGVYETLNETIDSINRYIANVKDLTLTSKVSKIININNSRLSGLKEEDNNILKAGVCVACYDDVFDPVLMRIAVYHHEIYIKYLDFETE